VDRVKLVGTGSTDGVKDFSIRVSNTTSTDSAFTTVLTATLPQDAREHWYSFAPVTAKYVQLFVTNNYGAPDFVRVPDFEVFSPQRGGATVPFVDLSTEARGVIVVWNWSFGDGSTSNAQYPLHTYAAPGTFAVQLTVTDVAGHSASANSTYTVQPPLVPSFTWSPLTPSEGGSSATVFTDTSGGLVTSREWRAPGAFINGEANAATLSLSFPDNGTYPVTLTVTDQNQVSASITQQVTVLNVPPSVALPSTFYAVGGQVTQFGSLSAVFDPGHAEALVCQWDFGDGATSDFDATNCTTLNHTYAAPPTGVRATTRTATLTARDKDGGQGSSTTQVVVSHALTLTPISTGTAAAIGVDYHEPTNRVLLSVNFSTGLPHNFDLVAPDGTRTQFSSVSGLSNEVYITSVRTSPCEGGFAIGETFTGTGRAGEIARISADGSSAIIPWVTLPGEPGLLRGGLFQDRYCAFGGDLIVVTDVGGVWRVTSAGVPTRLVAAGGGTVAGFLEGVTTVPNDPARYGPWAGKILAGNENNGCVYSIDAQGAAQCWLQDLVGHGIGGFEP
jgi:PKD repeat protein